MPLYVSRRFTNPVKRVSSEQIFCKVHLSAAMGMLLAIILPFVHASSPPYGVHLSWESEPYSSLTVTWRTDSVQASIVEYGLSDSYGHGATGAPGEIHHVRLTGLLPSTRYWYRCGDGLTWSHGSSFVTGPADDRRYSFAAYGDDRSNYDVRRSVGLSILNSGAEFALHTGDLVSDGRVQAQWDLWFESLNELLSSKVVMPVLGNHEENSPLYFDQFALPGNEQWYSFEYGNARFFALNTETIPEGEQLIWLQEELARCNSTWKFVYFHRPMYSSGYHGSDLGVRHAWEETLIRNGVDVVFCGHNHIYERTKPIRLGAITETTEGIVHLVTGGGGAGLHNLGAVLAPWTEIAVSEHHYLVVTVKGGSLHCEARLPDGTVFDRFEIHKDILPDLKVALLSTEPEYPMPGKASEISVVISNEGGAQAPESVTAILIDGEVGWQIPLPRIQPCEHTIVKVEWIPEVAGSRNMTVVVDFLDWVDEGLREDNNAVSHQIIASEPRADLHIVDMTCRPAPPRVNEPVMLLVSVGNIGSDSSGPFQVNVSVGGGEFSHTAIVQNLSPGAVATIETPWMARAGDWVFSVLIDPGDELEELRKHNNRRSIVLPVTEVVKEGPAYIAAGIKAGRPTVVYYNASEGLIGDFSASCVVTWGVDGWQRPHVLLAEPPTLALSRTFETSMQRFSDELWLCLLPSSQDIQTIDLRFSDRPVNPSIVDDNNGRNWRIIGHPWAEARLAGLAAAVQDAATVGVDVSAYVELLGLAGELLDAGDYRGLEDLVGNTTAEVRRKEGMAVLALGEIEYARGVKEGLNLGRVRIYLDGARTELERGNFHTSKNLCRLALDLIEQARAQIDEPIALLVASVLLLFVCRAGSAMSRSLFAFGAACPRTRDSVVGRPWKQDRFGVAGFTRMPAEVAPCSRITRFRRPHRCACFTTTATRRSGWWVPMQGRKGERRGHDRWTRRRSTYGQSGRTYGGTL